MSHPPAAALTATLVTTSPEATRATGVALAESIDRGLVIALRGNLGAGKTTFVQGLAAGLGVKAAVTSPTFILVNEYRAPRDIRLVHIDTYRLGDGDSATLLEAEALGLEEILDTPSAVVAIEWAERVAALLPPDHLLVALNTLDDDNGRTIDIHAYGPVSTAALAAFLRRETTLYTIASPQA